VDTGKRVADVKKVEVVIQQEQSPPDLYYSIRFQYDGYTYTAELLPEQQARDWVWRILARGTVQSSMVRIQSVDIFWYDKSARMFGRPGDVDPLTGRPLVFW
jgi:hypothetical protein